MGDIKDMKRDLRKLNRVRDAARLISRAVGSGFSREVAVIDGDRLVVLEHGLGRVIVGFWPRSDGYRVTVMSRHLEPRGHRRSGLPKAWALVRSLGVN
jgi:hypothetical protein